MEAKTDMEAGQAHKLSIVIPAGRRTGFARSRNGFRDEPGMISTGQAALDIIPAQ
jgi:hypothetical protein